MSLILLPVVYTYLADNVLTHVNVNHFTCAETQQRKAATSGAVPWLMTFRKLHSPSSGPAKTNKS